VLSKQGKGVNGIDDILTTRRISFIAVQPPQHSPSDKVNNNEALAIAATVHRIYELNKESFSPTQTVGVIVPYRNQIAEVRKAIEKSNIHVLQNITIDTVERYQGSQRDYIIYGFTIQKHYQLNFLANNTFEEDDCIIDRKLNVAMTRAKEHLVMFGNPELLANNIIFFRLMEFIRSKHGYFSVDLSDFIKGDFVVPDY
jgi:superfamily I DNA and/or RNA helicase